MSAKRAYSDEIRRSPDTYSDDFASDDDKKTPKHKRVPPPKKNINHRYYQDKLFGHGSGSLRNHGHSLKSIRGSGRGNSLSSEPADMKKSNDSVATRVLSASRNRINELRNKVEEMKITIRELERENKLFKTTQFRQEKTIQTFSDKENDLPAILEKHNNEIRVMREQNRRLKEKYEKSDRYLRDVEDELEKVKKKMNKYKEICEDNELMERDELSRKLTTAEQEVDERETKITELQKHIEVLKKSHKHELGIEFARQKDVKKQLEELKEKYSQLVNQLKEKDKALDYQNIHSNPRQGKLSRNHSPDSTLSWKTKRKTSSMTELTPREKAKFYSEKQRAELFKSKEELQKRPNKEKLMREEREMKDKEEREKREQKELQETEAKEGECHENKEKNTIDKHDIKKKIEEERKQQLKTENHSSIQEERKKKDELLKKLNAIDGPFALPLPVKKSEDQASVREGFNDSSFTKHNDNPRPTKSSHQDTTSTHLDRQKSKLQSSSDDAVGYKPSFGPTRENINKPGNKPTSVFYGEDDDDDDEPMLKINKTSTNTISQNKDKTPNLLESLFGPQANSSKNPSNNKPSKNDTLFITDKSPDLNSQSAAVTNSTFPWETNSDREKSNKSTFNSDKKPATRNEKSALFNVNTIESGNKVPSRLHRQQNSQMFPVKPSLTASDNFSEDIEEVVL